MQDAPAARRQLQRPVAAFRRRCQTLCVDPDPLTRPAPPESAPADSAMATARSASVSQCPTPFAGGRQDRFTRAGAAMSPRPVVLSPPENRAPRAGSPVCPTPAPQVASCARVRVVRASAAQGGIRGPISARTKVQRCDATSTRSSSVSWPAPSYSTRPAPRGMDGVGSPRGARHPVSVVQSRARAPRWSIHVS